MRHQFLILLLPIILFACKKDESVSNATPQYFVYKNISYGADQKQNLDLFIPPSANSDSTRTLILIHGGGWNSGDKSDFSDYISEFQKRLPGYAFASLNYRLITQTANYFPTQENDVQAAMNFIKDKSSFYKLSDQYILLGISAGGQLALLQAYKHNDAVPVKAVVSFFGPTDLKLLYKETDSSLLKGLQGATHVDPELFDHILTEASPINYASVSSPVTLMFHGDIDSIVPLNQAQMLHAKLDSLQVQNDLVIYKGEGHGWFGNNLVDSFNRLEVFLKSL